MMRQILPEGIPAATMLEHPEVIMQLFTAEGSPFALDTDQLIELTGRMHAIALARGTSGQSAAQIVEAIFQCGNDYAVRVAAALDVILDHSPDLNEADPAIKDHRAWIIDQVLRVLTKEHYQALRDCLYPPYNEGLEPPEPPIEDATYDTAES